MNAITEEQAANAARRTKISSEAWRRELGDPMPPKAEEPPAPASKEVEVEWWPPLGRMGPLHVTIAETGIVRLSTAVQRFLGPTVRIGGLATGEVVITACAKENPMARGIDGTGNLKGGAIPQILAHGFNAGKYTITQVDHTQKRILIRKEDRVTA